MLRLLGAWGCGDKLALDSVLNEVMADPTGVPGLLFCLSAFTSTLGEQVAPAWSDQLRGLLLDGERAADDDGRGSEGPRPTHPASRVRPTVAAARRAGPRPPWPLLQVRAT